jgi:hypothetical protein
MWADKFAMGLLAIAAIIAAITPFFDGSLSQSAMADKVIVAIDLFAGMAAGIFLLWLMVRLMVSLFAWIAQAFRAAQERDRLP